MKKYVVKSVIGIEVQEWLPKLTEKYGFSQNKPKQDEENST